MRLSSNKDAGPAFDAYQRFLIEHGVPHVFLDGVEQPKCCMADDEAGEIKRCVLDAEGRIQADPNNPEAIWTEIVTGKVEIRTEARWVAYETIGSPYEQERDVSHADGKWRHRRRATGDEPEQEWQEGPVPN